MVGKKIFLFLFLLLFSFFSVKSQEFIGIGPSAIYNIQSEGIGFGARVQIPVHKRLNIVPQLNYFAPFNIVHEINAGLNIHYNLVIRRKLIGYLTGGGYFNYWFNADVSPMENAKTINILPDVGVGMLFGKKCFRPFLEQRYNPLFMEGSFHIGFLWFPGCSSGRSYTCPAYN
ncbi:MAG: hypothetical protein M3Q58_16265 [Bacteroidota bacterium]|nr:hypothetical protein [Bacteroidota bacterium]